MEFAYSAASFRLRSLQEAVNAIAEGGFRAVELLADRPHLFPQDFQASRIDELSQCLEDRKMKVVNLNACSVSALGDGVRPAWIEEDWKQRELRIRYTLDSLRLAAALGIPSVTTNGGGPIPESMNEKEAWRLFVANMHRVLPLAAKLKVRLLVQCEPESLIRSSMQLKKLMEELSDLDALGVDFDPVHAWCAGEDPCEAFERLREHVVHIHLSDVGEDRKHRHLPLGEGAMDVARFLRCVQEAGYSGAVTVHVSSAEREAAEVVEAAVSYLRQWGFWRD